MSVLDINNCKPRLQTNLNGDEPSSETEISQLQQLCVSFYMCVSGGGGGGGKVGSGGDQTLFRTYNLRQSWSSHFSSISGSVNLTCVFTQCGQLQYPFLSGKPLILPHLIDPCAYFTKVFSIFIFFYICSCFGLEHLLSCHTSVIPLLIL